MDRIDISLSEYKGWCEKLGITTISDVNRLINTGKTNLLINISEIWHEQNISEIAKQIKNTIEQKKIILISGPSSSGKTTFATRLQLHLKVLGINAVSISLDNYYIPIEDMPRNEEGKPDYEALESIDYTRFNQNVADLINGKRVMVPIYHFGKEPSSERPLQLNPYDVIIVEGIHGLNEKLTANISNEHKYKIYCSALTALSKDDGTKIKSRTTRLIRRLIRDFYFRNSSYQFTLDIWPNVEAGAQKNIFPYTDGADLIFNSSLLYELAAYRKPLNMIFENVSEQNPHFDQITELLELVNSFEPIDTAMIPGTSLVKEFVGGNTLDI